MVGELAWWNLLQGCPLLGKTGRRAGTGDEYHGAALGAGVTGRQSFYVTPIVQ